MRYPTLADWETARDSDQHSKVRELLPRLDWHALWEQEDEEEWLHYPLVAARRLTAVFSAAGAGKSLLLLEMAAGLSTGRKVLGHGPGRRIRTLYIDFENDPRGDVRTRLQDMGYEPADLDHLDYLSFPSLPYLDSEGGAAALLAAVEAYSPELVVIDTISRAVGGEENDNDTWLNFYKHTGLAMKQHGVALIRLDHTGKDATKGERGGSAKRGDIDASWLLTEVIPGERYRLECVKHRFELQTTELTLIRHGDPLHHEVQDVGAGGGDREAKIRHIVDLADRDELPEDTGRDRLKAWAIGHNLKARTDLLSEVVRRRKHRPKSIIFATRPERHAQENLSPTKNDGNSPPTVPDLSPETNGKHHFPWSDLSPTNGDSPGTGPTPDLSPLVPPYKGDRGQGQDPKPGDEPCTECGQALGYAMVRRGLAVHKPECPKVVTSK